MRKIFFLFLLVSMALSIKAQIQPLSRQPAMRPIEPPRVQGRFTQTWGKRVTVKYTAGIDYNVYSQELMNAAIKQGDAKAQFALGYLYYYGQTVPQSFSLAAKYLKMAADKGLAEAQCKIGLCYADGLGTDKNEMFAFKYFQKAHLKGNVEATVYLAWCYFNGFGVE